MSPPPSRWPDPPRVGRLAPSPTGALHLGNVRTFMAAWLQMRAVGGRVLLRIEDLDHPQHKPGADAALLDDLRWLGFDWDGPALRQSARLPAHRAALARLPHYPCWCTRADIQGAQSAPHPGEVLRYPGTCRHRAAPPPPGRTPAWRLPLQPTDDGRFDDAFAGPQTRTADQLTGDFVIARGDEPAYVLASLLDDADSGVTDVVRGDDILPVTPAQNRVADPHGLPPPPPRARPHHLGPPRRRQGQSPPRHPHAPHPPPRPRPPCHTPRPACLVGRAAMTRCVLQDAGTPGAPLGRLRTAAKVRYSMVGM